MTSKDKSNITALETSGNASGETVRVVGIGASAGGLQALESFFGNVPEATRLSFVVVQHMDPDKESALVALLQRVTRVPVSEITDGTPVRPGHCHVAPPGFEVSLLRGVLHLARPETERGHGRPIDMFFGSLAADQPHRAAAVILSGMGSDGTAGARDLRKKGGGVFVQLPATAEFEAMPLSAIDADVADVVAEPQDLPARIAGFFANTSPTAGLADTLSSGTHVALEKILLMVRAQTGHDFSAYKKGTVYRRIQRRMAIHQLATVEDYALHVRQNSMEAELLYKELLIGVTSFFRDPEVWQDLKEMLALQLSRNPGVSQLRAWVAACSTGEEAYTLAIVFAEVVAELEIQGNHTLQIFATDLEKDAIARGRTGVYPQTIKADVSEERLKRFFIEVPGGYQVTKELRTMIVFAQHSIASDPPFARLDVLSCRNLLIYLEPDLQKRLLPLFHHSLNPGGLLVLGSAETPGQTNNLFGVANPRTRIYRRLERLGRPVSAGFPVSTGASLMAFSQPSPPSRPPVSGPSLQVLADQVLVRRYAPSAVLVTAQGDIVYFSGKTGKYLEPAAGKANLNLFSMARPGLAQPLAEVFYRAVRQKTVAVIDPVSVAADGQTHTFTVTVEPLEDPEALRGLVMVVFAEADVPPVAGESEWQPGNHDQRVAELGGELARSREEHQSTREDMQIAQESLLSANEELQSANEELTTSREEMQSINEELQTVNSELQARVDALARASDDMENLLNSTEIATLFLDQKLNVRRFTTRATGLIKLIPGDVGRPITDIVSDMNYTQLADDAREVLRTLMFKEKEVSATEGRWFMVRTMPYRTQDNRIDGVVITFADISVAKRLEASLRLSQGG